MNEIELLESLSNYYIEFGIFITEGLQTVDVNVTGEETDTTIKMKIADIMFFTEYGTISIPGTFVLDKSLSYIDNLLNDSISLLTDKILMGEIINSSEVDSYFSALCLKIENEVQGFMRSIIQNNNKLSNIVKGNNVDDNKYIYDLTELSKYVKCKFFKTNL